MDDNKVYHLTGKQLQTLAKLSLINGRMDCSPEKNEEESTGWVTVWDTSTRLDETINKRG
jgi:hypothetical protein